jgi:GDSL-like Lipase/Acylhydrolase family
MTESADKIVKVEPQYSRPKRRRLLCLLVAGASAIAAAAAYIEFHFHLPEGNGPAGPVVAAAPFDHVWTGRKILLIGLGDSVTAGFGAGPGRSYFERLLTNPVSDEDMQGKALLQVLPNLQTRNLAMSGSNSLQHLAIAAEKLDLQPIDVFGLVVMTSGGNDLIHWYGRTLPQEGAMYGSSWEQAQPWIAAFANRLQQIFALIRQRFPGGCRIFIADIYDPSDGQGDPESAWLPAWPSVVRIHGAYNEAIHQAAAQFEFVHVVPMHAAFLGHGIHCRKFWRRHYRASDPHYWYASNLEDPNERGYDAIRRVFLNAICQDEALFR